MQIDLHQVGVRAHEGAHMCACAHAHTYTQLTHTYTHTHTHTHTHVHTHTNHLAKETIGAFSFHIKITIKYKINVVAVKVLDYGHACFKFQICTEGHTEAIQH